MGRSLLGTSGHGPANASGVYHSRIEPVAEAEVDRAIISGYGYDESLPADVLAASGATDVKALAADPSLLADSVELVKVQSPDKFLPSAEQQRLEKIPEGNRRWMASYKAALAYRQRARGLQYAQEKVDAGKQRHTRQREQMASR